MRQIRRRGIFIAGDQEGNGQLNVRLWDDKDYGLLQRFGIMGGVEKALSRRVWLKSGGFLIIEPTEALTVIDVNSGKASSKKKSPEDFNLKMASQ